MSAGRLAENPQALADLTAHEFFHLWDVKRIRPQSLEPVDYTKENYTRALWFSEGVDTTAGNIILLRAGLLDEPRYLKGLAAEIGELERRPAHLTQSAEESSLDAWLEKYEYYRLPSRSISYYNKGYLLGVLLDLQVREATHGSASLRDVLQWMNRNYARQGKFFPDSDGVRQAAEAVSHTNLGWFFQKYVAGTDEIPWDDFFKTVGLHLVARTISVANVEFVAPRNLNATPVVAAITPGSAAQRAGLALGDVILEVNGRPADADFEERLAELRPGEKLHLRVRNSDGEHELHWKLASREQIELDLADVDNVTAAAEGPACCLAQRRIPDIRRSSTVIRTILMLAFWSLALPMAALLGFPWTFLTGDIRFLYRVAMWSAWTGVRLAGIRVQTIGLDRLDPKRTYRVHVEPCIQHRSTDHGAADSAAHLGHGEEGAV